MITMKYHFLLEAINITGHLTGLLNILRLSAWVNRDFTIYSGHFLMNTLLVITALIFLLERDKYSLKLIMVALLQLS